MPGDRKSTCGGRMKPIGLKQRSDGEIMIIHECLSCGKISPNRIAGDDIPETIISLLSVECNTHRKFLNENDLPEIRLALFGNASM